MCTKLFDIDSEIENSVSFFIYVCLKLTVHITFIKKH